MSYLPAGIEIEIEIAVRISADGSTAHIKAPTMFLDTTEAEDFVLYLKDGQIGAATARAHLAAERIEDAIKRAHALVDLISRSA